MIKRILLILGLILIMNPLHRKALRKAPFYCSWEFLGDFRGKQRKCLPSRFFMTILKAFEPDFMRVKMMSRITDRSLKLAVIK